MYSLACTVHHRNSDHHHKLLDTKSLKMYVFVVYVYLKIMNIGRAVLNSVVGSLRNSLSLILLAQSFETSAFIIGDQEGCTTFAGSKKQVPCSHGRKHRRKRMFDYSSSEE